MMGVLNFLPLHVQGVMGGVATEAGLVIAPMLVGWPIAAALTSRMLGRIGYRRPIWLGAALAAAGVVALVPLVTSRAPLWTLGAALFVHGFGVGLANTAIVIGVQASVGWNQRGVATAAMMFARSIGGALGVGALGALMAQRLGRTVAPDVASALLDPHRRASALEHPGVVDALGRALHPVFWCGAVAALLTAVVLLAYPRDQSPEERSPIPS
jgi:MFS family permease